MKFPGSSESNSLYARFGVLAFLVLLLLVPTFFIDNLVSERQFRREESIREISSKWGLGQTINGPILSIPYREYFRDSLERLMSIRGYLHVLPERLQANAKLDPEIRYRSIYEVAVYSTNVRLEGNFNLGMLNESGIPLQNFLWNEAFIGIGISDLRGIEDQVQMKFDQKVCTFNSGLETQDVIASGIHCPLRLNFADSTDKLHTFQISFKLRGSDFIRFAPIGKVTDCEISSSWKTPSFDGAFLPDRRHVDAGGFKAYWNVLHLNRNYPQSWTDAQFNTEGSEFGLSLLVPVDQYQKTERSMKYAILFIGLTFLIFFFLELINGLSVHPFQYLLIGLALCLFYTLLLSISEHLGFTPAFLIASVMTIGLVGLYSASVLHAKNLAVMIGLTLSVLYGFIFSIIQMEDYALLMGSIGLFIILAITMYYSRKIDWNNVGREVPKQN
jgi:inner membrane protein